MPRDLLVRISTQEKKRYWHVINIMYVFILKSYNNPTSHHLYHLLISPSQVSVLCKWSRSTALRHADTDSPPNTYKCHFWGNRALGFCLYPGCRITLLSFQYLCSLVTFMQCSSPVTAQYQRALSKETHKINSFLFLAQNNITTPTS